ncbi:MAG: hypothetical protein HUU10_12880 [Bacteroidetes bacterium]|nr:hypothetical protein [Bacteroidota bacterium]
MYSYKRVKGNRYIMLEDGDPINNHLGNPFPALTEERALQFMVELKIIQYNEFIPPEDRLRTSFTYCVLSTMMEASGRTFPLTVDDEIQWDRAFRLNPGPPLLLLEQRVINQAKVGLQSPWVNLDLNYCSTPEEMRENGTAFVPANIIAELNGILSSFLPVERFMVMLLSRYMVFGITLPVLWVADRIDDTCLADGYWVFGRYAGPRKFKREKDLLLYRLSFLKKLQIAYRNGEKGLPV